MTRAESTIAGVHGFGSVSSSTTDVCVSRVAIISSANDNYWPVSGVQLNSRPKAVQTDFNAIVAKALVGI